MIQITLKEYKKLRDIVEQYYVLLNNYNLLANQYNLLVEYIEPEEEHKQNTIGFK